MKQNNHLSPFHITRGTFSALVLLFTAISWASPVHAQSFDAIDRGRAQDMLNNVKNEIKNNYYDPAFHGMDLNVRFKVAEEKLSKATSMGQAFGIIAQAVIELSDSHTKFYPPTRAAKAEYGWRMQIIGDKCLVTAVKPNSDAEKQGLKPGDEVISIEGFRPNRKELWKVQYYYDVISPRAGLKLVVKSPGAVEPRTLDLAAKVTVQKRVLTIDDLIRQYELGEGHGSKHRFVRNAGTITWKMPNFLLDPADVDDIMSNRVAKSTNLILDLRGNGGGYVVSLERLAGYFVEKDTKIADLKGRKEMKPQMAKTRGDKTYRGKIVVLIDSDSGSAAEIFARFIQLQERGTVIGDRSAGAVMQSRGIPMELGAASIVPYGMSLTNADVIMADGISLEHIGVTPQMTSIPNAADLSAKRDPVLAAALASLGQNISPEDAGKLFPYEWDEDQ